MRTHSLCLVLAASACIKFSPTQAPCSSDSDCSSGNSCVTTDGGSFCSPVVDSGVPDGGTPIVPDSGPNCGSATLCAGGYCADLVSDNLNCGTCGAACAAGQSC